MKHENMEVVGDWFSLEKLRRGGALRRCVSNAPAFTCDIRGGKENVAGKK